MVSPILNAQGKPEKLLASSRDVTDWKRSQELLGAIINGTSGVTGIAFFRSLVQHLAQGLHVRWAFVAECQAACPMPSAPAALGRYEELLARVDVDAVYLDFGTAAARPLRRATADELTAYAFAAGSMGPKVEAAVRFVTATGGRAAIGSLSDVDGLVAGTAGTVVKAKAAGDRVRS